jgi:APA family basic amino acid/polyamine antiporter
MVDGSRVGLRRVLGPFDVTVYGVGIIIGAGIYALIGKAAGIAGGAVWMSYGIAAIVAALTALSYAELTSIFPKSAAEYVYTDHAFRRKWLAFVVGWLAIYNMTIVASTVSLGFGGYFSALTGVPMLVGAVALIILMSLLNYSGIKESANANALLTLLEVGGLLIIIVLGWSHLGSVDYFSSPGGFGGVMTAALLVFFAFLGFEDVANIAEETKNPKHVIPMGLLLALGISTLLYMLVSVAAVSVVPPEQLAASNAPLALVANTALPGSGSLLSLLALVATTTTVLTALIASSRMIWAMSRDGALPRFLSAVHPVRRTPWAAIALVGMVAAAVAFIGRIEIIAQLTDFGAFLLFAVVNLAVIVLRYREPGDRRMFRTPLNIGRFPVIPALGFIANMVMLFYFSLQMFIVGTAVLVVGYLVYLSMKKLRVISI